MSDAVTERMIPGGSFIPITAINPDTVCCEGAQLVCGLRTLGVPVHPANAVQIATEEIAGKAVTTWQWMLADKAADGTPTGDIIKRWNDPLWLAANPLHEIAIVRAAVHNMGVVAREIRETIPRIVIRRGQLTVRIPANATPAHRAHLIGQFEGTIPLNAKFVEPEPQSAS